MARPLKNFHAVIVTANDLRSGQVVFRRADGAWTNEAASAEVAASRDAAEALLERARADHAACRVVEPVLIEIIREAGIVRPTALRELIRASGPTIALPLSA